MRRKNSLRLSYLDYRTGTFLITVNTHRRRRVLGTLDGEHVVPSSMGEYVREAWTCILSRRPRVIAHAFELMPDHWHAVVTLDESASTLGSIVGSAKSRATRRARNAGPLDPEQPLWQRGYHARWIADDDALARAIAYVENNPRAATG